MQLLDLSHPGGLVGEYITNHGYSTAGGTAGPATAPPLFQSGSCPIGRHGELYQHLPAILQSFRSLAQTKLYIME